MPGMELSYRRSLISDEIGVIFSLKVVLKVQGLHIGEVKAFPSIKEPFPKDFIWRSAEKR